METGITDIIWRSLTSSSFVGMADIYILIIMSIWSWSIILFKFFSLQKTQRRTVEDFEVFQQAGDLTEGMRILSARSRSSVYRVGLHAVQEIKRLEKSTLDPRHQSDQAMDNVRRALRQGVGIEMDMLGTSLSFLGTCANAGPLLGLFGTVWGIMRSFNDIGMMKSANLAVVGPGIAEALVTTVFGLIVAIPASVAYNALVSKLGKIETVLVNYAGAFLNRMQREMSVNGQTS